MNLPARYAEMIQSIVDTTGMHPGMLHIHCGMAIYLGALLLLKGPRAPLHALCAVAAAEFFNEVMDRIQHGSWRWPDTSADIVLTLFWPTMCYLVARWTARRRSRR